MDVETLRQAILRPDSEHCGSGRRDSGITRLCEDIAVSAPSDALRRPLRLGHDFHPCGFGPGGQLGWQLGPAPAWTRVRACAWPCIDRAGFDLAGMAAPASAGVAHAGKTYNGHVGRICAGHAVLCGDLSFLYIGAHCSAWCCSQYRLPQLRRGTAVGIRLGAGDADLARRDGRRLAGKPVGVEPISQGL